MSFDVEAVVVGAGVVGLAAAHALARTGHEVLVIEQHRQAGAETSSRNSEVIHAGLYYPPGSLKARLCIEGKALLYDFATENGIAHRRLGKLLVATTEAERAKLEAIAANARLSGVDDLVPLDACALRAREPELSAVTGYLSPSTGIIDSHGLLQALEGHLAAAGGSVVFATQVRDIARTSDHGFRLATTGGDTGGTQLTCGKLVIAAGLHASALARHLFADGAAASGYQVPETRYAKGHYFTLAGRAPFSHLVYPMPEDGGLGVHLTLDMGGAAKFGPDVQWIERIDYSFENSGGARQAAFVEAIRRWWPGLPDDALSEGYTGIRPKLGAPGATADFAIHDARQHGLEGLVALYGIESPGLTASLAIARHVADCLRRA